MAADVEESTGGTFRGLPLHPIIILATPRSGSSMTAGIFHLHGVWVGRCREPDVYNKKGFFENLNVKRALLDTYGRLVNQGIVAEYDERFFDNLDINPTSPWLVKHSAMYWKTWEPLEPIYICVRRDTESCIQSNTVSGMMQAKNISRSLKIHNEEMDKSEGLNIYTDEIIDGDDSSLRKAIEHCGIKYDPSITEQFVDKRLWHYVRSA